jgi:hypothetical protein
MIDRMARRRRRRSEGVKDPACEDLASVRACGFSSVRSRDPDSGSDHEETRTRCIMPLVVEHSK